MARTLLLGLVLLTVAGCRLVIDGDPLDAATAATGADAATPPDAGLQGQLTVQGRVCTRPAFTKTKVLFLLDSSGSMCVTDGPGGQGGSGICEQIASQLAAQGITVPGRIRGMKQWLQALGTQPGVSVTVIPFELRPMTRYPTTGFAAPTDPDLHAFLDGLPQKLGKGTDYQGALAAGRLAIDDDIDLTLATEGKDTLARTRYVVVFVSDGYPYPRCQSKDGLGNWATAADPSGPWQDLPESFCNTPSTPDAGENPECLGTGCPGDAGVQYSTEIPDFPVGGDRNQNEQLFAEVEGMVALQAARGVGEIRLDAVMLSNPALLASCGAVCATDLYGLPGGTPDDGLHVARWTMKQLARRGHGTFREFTDPALIRFDWLGGAGLGVALEGSTPLLRRFAGPTTSDTAGELPVRPDGDGDGFPDAFELAHAAQGFDPAVPDMRGCRSVAGGPVKLLCEDEDGDGLPAPVEAFLGTDPTQADTDGDGLPDGVEFETGLDPLTSNIASDTDQDSVPDLQEVLLGTDPRASGGTPHGAVAVTPGVQPDGSTCYDFTIPSVWLSPSGMHRRNYLTVAFREAPKGTGTPATWRQACFFSTAPAQGAAAVPVKLEDADFVPLWRFDAASGQALPPDYRTLCKNAP